MQKIPSKHKSVSGKTPVEGYLKEIRASRLAAFRYLKSIVNGKGPESSKMKAAEMLLNFNIQNAFTGLKNGA